MKISAKNQSVALALLIIFAFTLRVCVGLYSGGAGSDAGDYTTLSIQMDYENDYSYIFETQSGREVFHLWLLVLVSAMKIFGATNIVAIVTTAIFGSFSLFLFYKLLRLFWNFTSSLMITILLVFNPIHINISQNAAYEAIFLCILFLSLIYYFKYFKYKKLKHLIIAGVIGSLMVFVHATGYIYIFLLWLCFPIFHKDEFLKSWIYFSISIGFLALTQALVWLYFEGSVFPYAKLQENWRFFLPFSNNFQFKHYVRHLIYLVMNYSPLIFLGLLSYLLFDFGKKKINIFFSSVFIIGIIYTSIMGSYYNVLTPVSLIITICFVLIFKRNLISKNRLVFLFGLFGLVVFSLYLKTFPRTSFGPRQFIYSTTFFLPVAWFYLNKRIKRKYIFISGISIYIVLFFVAFIANLPANNKKSLPGFNAPFSSILAPALPYYNIDYHQKRALKFLQKENIDVNDYIISNVYSRYLNANLNLPQNHYLRVWGLSYSHEDGFKKVNLNYYINWISKEKPNYIIWDVKRHEQQYNTFNNKGERRFNFSFPDFESVVSRKYEIISNIDEIIFIYKRI